MVEDEKASNARRDWARREDVAKENKKLTEEASLPGATCCELERASPAAARHRCVCVARKGVRHGRGNTCQ
jgi:hypothetical protein